MTITYLLPRIIIALLVLTAIWCVTITYGLKAELDEIRETATEEVFWGLAEKQRRVNAIGFWSALISWIAWMVIA